MKPPNGKLEAARAVLASLTKTGKAGSRASTPASNAVAVAGDEPSEPSERERGAPVGDAARAGGPRPIRTTSAPRLGGEHRADGAGRAVDGRGGGPGGPSGAGSMGSASRPAPLPPPAQLSELGELAELRSSKTYSGLSLKARALKMLALRDLSAAELRRKLRAVVAATPEMGKTDADIDELLADFSARGWQSDTRFAEQLARRRSKFGNARLAQELKSHGLDKSTVADTLDAAGDSEYARALGAWQKKFGQAAAHDAKSRAKQARFLAARGFSAELIFRVMRQGAAGQDAAGQDDKSAEE